MNWQTKLAQTSNVMKTLVEASEHLFILMKEKKYNEGVSIFNSFVEGYEAVESFQINNNMSEDFLIESEKTKKILREIVGNFELNNLIKISAILQFSLLPQMKKWTKMYNELGFNELNDTNNTIGIYLSHASPRMAYTEDRIEALIEEGNIQGQVLLFFSSKDIDFDEHKISCEIFSEGEWIKANFDFPKVIHNIFPQPKSFQSKEERKLRRMVPFTSFSVGNKYTVPEKLVKTGRFTEYFVPFKVCTDTKIIYSHLTKNKSVVFKPILGRRGEQIYFVEREKNKYIVSEHLHKKSYSKDEFDNWLEEVILKKRKSYIVQTFIKSKTKNSEPFDIRAHLQKNGEGKWTITKMYPRIGKSKSILSNISRGGHTLDINTFLHDEYKLDSTIYKQKLNDLSYELTAHLDKVYGYALDELGLDIAIDTEGRFWIHEVNNGPQSTYHEKERAKNTISYALYVKDNGLFMKNEFENRPNLPGQFFLKNSELILDQSPHDKTIAMLVDSNNKELKLAEACAYVSKYEDCNFFYFSPNDIDFENMCIRGSFYEKGKWEQRIVQYPDFIYDRLRLKGHKILNYIYEELEHIPLTNQLYGNSINKNEVYDELNRVGTFENYIIPYKKVNRVKDVMDFINKYEIVIMKPEVGSFARGVVYIERVKFNEYLFIEGAKKLTLNEFELVSHVRERIKSASHLVQEFINTRTKDDQPFDIRVHMLKNRDQEWDFAKIYPRIGVHHAVISATTLGGYIGEIQGFINRNFNEENTREIIQDIEELSRRIAFNFEKRYDSGLSEIALDLAIDGLNCLKIIELNVNKPGVFHNLEVAQLIIPYCLSKLKNDDI